MSIKIIKINPIIDTPQCVKNGEKQDCFNCSLFSTNKCISPRKLCALPYKNHPRGCPKYGMKNSCPPKAPMFDIVFDMTKEFYAIISSDSSNEKAKEKLFEQVKLLKSQNQNYYACLSPEALGVNLTKTLKHNLEWPIKTKVSRVAIIGHVKDYNYINILN